MAQTPNKFESTPLFRSYNSTTGDHFYCSDSKERLFATQWKGYTAEEDMGRVLTSPKYGSGALYRAFNNKNHFYTMSYDEWVNACTNLNYTNQGEAGYIYSEHLPGTMPLYRSYNGQKDDHFYTISKDEHDRSLGMGYKDEGITGYVLQ